jgi:hypothetical protein
MGIGLCLPKDCSQDDYESVLENVDMKEAITTLLGEDPKLYNVPLKGALYGHPHAAIPFDKL